MTRWEKNHEVYVILNVGEDWEVELEKTTYLIGTDTICTSLNMQPSLVPSIVNWITTFDKPLTDAAFAHCGFEINTSDACQSPASDSLSIKRIVLFFVLH